MYDLIIYKFYQIGVNFHTRKHIHTDVTRSLHNPLHERRYSINFRKMCNENYTLTEESCNQHYTSSGNLTRISLVTGQKLRFLEDV